MRTKRKLKAAYESINPEVIRAESRTRSAELDISTDRPRPVRPSILGLTPAAVLLAPSVGWSVGRPIDRANAVRSVESTQGQQRNHRSSRRLNPLPRTSVVLAEMAIDRSKDR